MPGVGKALTLRATRAEAQAGEKSHASNATCRQHGCRKNDTPTAVALSLAVPSLTGHAAAGVTGRPRLQALKSHSLFNGSKIPLLIGVPHVSIAREPGSVAPAFFQPENV